MKKNIMHTPGPWGIENGFDENGEGRYFPSVTFKPKTGFSLGRFVINESHDQKPPSIMANARLIQKGPEMYDLLLEAKEALINKDAVKCYNPADEDCNCTICKIKKILLYINPKIEQ